MTAWLAPPPRRGAGRLDLRRPEDLAHRPRRSGSLDVARPSPHRRHPRHDQDQRERGAVRPSSARGSSKRSMGGWPRSGRGGGRRWLRSRHERSRSPSQESTRVLHRVGKDEHQSHTNTHTTLPGAQHSLTHSPDRVISHDGSRTARARAPASALGVSSASRSPLQPRRGHHQHWGLLLWPSGWT